MDIMVSTYLLYTEADGRSCGIQVGKIVKNRTVE